MKRAVLIGLVVLLAGVGVYFGWRYYRDVYLPNKQVEDALDEQEALFAQIKPSLAPLSQEDAPAETAEPAESAPEAPAVDWLAELRAVNPDTVGWLTIEGTAVDYPIVQAQDNAAYLRTGYDGAYNYVGCPFLDAACDPDFGGFCSIIYAHYIPGRPEMFADIVKYKDSDFLREHPRGVLLTESGPCEVRFFAYLSVRSDSPLYEPRQETQAEREAYIDGMFDRAKYALELPGTSPEELKSSETPRLLLLSTCSYEYEKARAVLVGVIAEE